ncbi:MAG: hypothetical protein H0V56_04220 [Chthoniobacterales bacterium]|nr:hypothetical protein [Chthoniobacterales bacterium]
MPDPVDPIPPSTPPPPLASESGTSSTGLPSNVAAALACIPLLGGIIFYALEKNDRFVRFYAMQSIIFGGAWVVFAIIWNVLYSVLAGIPAIGWLFALILWMIWAAWSIGAVIVWVITMIKAFTGTRWDIPYIGPIARAQVDGPTTV